MPVSIVGTLTDVNGDPVEGKRIAIEASAGYGGGQVATTDAAGLVSFVVGSLTAQTVTYNLNELSEDVDGFKQNLQVTYTEPGLFFIQGFCGVDSLYGFSDGNLVSFSLSGVQAGNLLVVLVGITRDTTTVPSEPAISCAQGALTLVTTITAPPFATFLDKLYVYYIENTGAGDYAILIDTPAIIYPTQRYYTGGILEYAGLAAAASLFASTTGSGTSLTPSVTAPAREDTDDLIVSCYFISPRAQDSPPVLDSTEYASRFLLFPTFNVAMGIADYADVAVPGSAEWTIDDDPTNLRWASAALSFRKA